MNDDLAAAEPRAQEVVDSRSKNYSCAKRVALRNHPLVVEALQLWWTTALRSMQSGGEQLEKTDYIVPARALQPDPPPSSRRLPPAFCLPLSIHPTAVWRRR